jgi:hypothetical protein
MSSDSDEGGALVDARPRAPAAAKKAAAAKPSAAKPSAAKPAAKPAAGKRAREPTPQVAEGVDEEGDDEDDEDDEDDVSAHGAGAPPSRACPPAPPA